MPSQAESNTAFTRLPDGSFQMRLGGGVLRICRADFPKENKQEIYSRAIKVSQQLNELDVMYGIPNAGYVPFFLKAKDTLGIDSDNLQVAVYSPDIAGAKVSREDTERNPVYRQAATELLGQLSKYVYDKYASDESMLTDIFSLEQYVYSDLRRKFVLKEVCSEVKDDEYYKHEAVVMHLEPLAALLLDPQEYTVWADDMQPLLEFKHLIKEDFTETAYN